MDNVPGTSGNDTIIGAVDDTNAELNTMSALDGVNGGAGIDTLRVSFNDATTDAIALPNLSDIEIIEVQATQDFTLDTSTTAGVTDVNVTKATGTTGLEGSNAQNISVTGAQDDIAVDGGKNITVTDATVDTAIDIGNGATGPYAAGTITVTDTKQGTGDITIDGGTDVTVTATVAMDADESVSGGDILIGADKEASGAVVVTQNLNSDGGDADGDDLSAADIAISGGTTVDVTVNATVTAKDEDAEGDIAVGKVTVEGDGNTTSVKITQNATATEFETAKIAEVYATQSVTFKDLDEDGTVTVNGLTFTAAKDLTAAEVAQAFANLAANDKQEDGGPVVNGFYSDAFITVADWTSGAASGATVVFTAPAHDSAALVISSSVVASAPTAAPIVAGTAVEAATSTTNAITKGFVTVVDNDITDAITTVTLDGFKGAAIGVDGTESAVSQLDALTTLNLANNTKDDVIEVGTTATTLELNVNNITSTGATYINLDNDGNGEKDANSKTVETLTINATGAASSFELVAGALKNLTVNASVGLNVSDTAASYATANLEAVDINGAGAVSLGDVSASVALNSFDASGNTGGVTATVEGDGTTLTGDLEEYVFSGGNDSVTVEVATGSAVDVKVSLGAGDDKLTLNTGINTAGEVLDGGTGTNTLSMVAADAVTASATNTFEGKISNFQKLSLSKATTAGTVDLANMDDISYVISAGSDSVASAATKTTFSVTVALTQPATAGDTVTFAGQLYTLTAPAATAAALATQLYSLISAVPPAGWVVKSVGGAVLSFEAFAAGATAAPASASLVDENPTVPVSAATLTVGSAVVGAAEGTPTAALTLDNMADDGTLELTAATAGVIVQVTDAGEVGQDSNVLNVIVSDALTAAGIDVGSVVVDDVETVDVTVNDAFTDDGVLGGTADDGKDDVNAAHTIDVDGDSVVTINVDGAGDVTLTTTSTVLESVNGADLTGALTYIALVADTVVTGGSGKDILTASANEVTINGGAGNDRIAIVDNVDKVEVDGGAGSDTFIIAGAASNKDSYAVFKNVASGDIFDFGTLPAGDVSDFRQAKITLSEGATESSQAYLNQAVKDLDLNEMGWFQFGGNTFVVVDKSDSDAAFEDGVDVAIMITGTTVNLATGATFNTTSDLLEII